MTVNAATSFDLGAFKRAYEEWDRAAATVTCEFPGGRKVLANTILELADGRIVRERTVVAGDPKGS